MAANLYNRSVEYYRQNTYVEYMNSKEFQRWLKNRGCTFVSNRGGTGHITVKLGNKKAQMPMHGSRKELGKGLVQKIKKDLGLK